MKKTLAFILVCALLVSAFALTAFADGFIGDNDVGTGVTEFDDKTSGAQNVQVTVSTITHNYAVDVEFTPYAYKLPSLVWDVNELKYVETGADFDGETKIVVTNYSDLSINASVAVNDTVDADGLVFEFTTATAQTVAAVVGDTETAGTPTNATFSGRINEPTAAELKTAVLYYTEGDGSTTVVDNKVTIATYTVTVTQ